jgi:methionyl-tRNA formyltransferase
MRFAFAGIDFLGDVFETLLAKGWEPVKLFSRPCDSIYDFNDATVSRARSLRLPVQFTRIQPSDLASLKVRKCDALVVAGYPWLIKGWEAHLPYGLNFHPSPLPVGRGPYPLFQAILDASPEWGVTAHVLEPAFDTGPMIAQERFALAPDESHDTLLARCQIAARRIAGTLADRLPELWQNAKPQGGRLLLAPHDPGSANDRLVGECERRAAHHQGLRLDRDLRESGYPLHLCLGGERMGGAPWL